MALTATEARARSDRQAAGSDRLSGRLAAGPRAWASERGATVWSGTAEVRGEFPGYAPRGGRLVGAKVAVSARYLLVDEGRPSGFGLPLRWLVGTRVDGAAGAGGEATVRVGYDDGTLVRWFAIRPRGPGLLRRNGDGAAGAVDALTAAGVRRFAPADAAPAPAWSLSLNAARQFEHENVIWSGLASVPAALDGEPAAAAVWLTTRSLIWNPDDGRGVNRLPLSLLRDLVPARLEDRAENPVLYVAFGSDEERFGLPFRFDRHATEDRNHRERGAFVVGLRSRGVPLGTTAQLVQPWRSTGAAAPAALAERDPTPIGSGVTVAAPDPPATNGFADKPDGIGSIWPSTGCWAAGGPASGAVAKRGPSDGLGPTIAAEMDRSDDGADAAQRSERLGASVAAFEPRTGAPPRIEPAPVGHGWPAPTFAPELPLARAFEAASLAALVAVLGSIGDAEEPALAPGAPPQPPGQAEALAELDAAVAAGVLGAEAVAARKARLMALLDAAPRLHALLELRDAGHLSGADVVAKRAAILAPLARQLFVSVV